MAPWATVGWANGGWGSFPIYMAAAPPKKDKRPYHQIEKRLVAEYMHEFHTNQLTWIRPRLGKFRAPKHGTEEERMERRWEAIQQRYPDAVAFDGKTLHIIEGKIIADAKTVGQLEHYEELIIETDEFMALGHAHIKKLVVAVLVPPDIRAFLEKRGIDWKEFKPDWAVRYMESRQWR